MAKAKKALMKKKAKAPRAKISHAKMKKNVKQTVAKKDGFKAPSARDVKKLKMFLSDVPMCEFLLGLAGENAGKVLGSIEGAMSDEEIARIAKLRVSDVRSVLNKLHGQGIAIYERTRDKDTGWYYYKWSISPSAMESTFTQKKRGDKEAAERMAFENSYNVYTCGTCAQEKYPFETALDYLFKCPKCGSSLEYVNGAAAAAKEVKKEVR